MTLYINQYISIIYVYQNISIIPFSFLYDFIRTKCLHEIGKPILRRRPVFANSNYNWCNLVRAFCVEPDNCVEPGPLWRTSVIIVTKVYGRSWGPLPTWIKINNYLSIPKLWGQYHWSLGIDKKFHPTLYCAFDYLSMLRLKLTLVVKSAPGELSLYLSAATQVHFEMPLGKQLFFWRKTYELLTY